jgi:hypothetical protein
MKFKDMISKMMKKIFKMITPTFLVKSMLTKGLNVLSVMKISAKKTI